MNTDIALSSIQGGIARAKPETVARESHVQSQMGNLEKITSALGTQVDQLETRLRGVITPGCPDTPEKGNTSPPEPNLCQLGSDLREIARSLSGTSLRLRQIMGNLEL